MPKSSKGALLLVPTAALLVLLVALVDSGLEPRPRQGNSRSDAPSAEALLLGAGRAAQGRAAAEQNLSVPSARDAGGDAAVAGASSSTDATGHSTSSPAAGAEPSSAEVPVPEQKLDSGVTAGGGAPDDSAGDEGGAGGGNTSDAASGASADMARALTCYHMACLFLENEQHSDVSQVPSLLRESWENGYAPAAVKLLDVFEGKHKGLKASPAEALALAESIAADEEGAARDHARRLLQLEVLYRMAFYYEKGFAGEALPRRAFHCMKKAAERGLYKAQAELARYRMRGIGCTPAPQEAIRLLLELHRTAPDTPNLYYYLGYMCSQGLGLKHALPAKAVEFYKEGLRHRDPNAINNLGALYERGTRYTPRNYDLALKLYRLAASMGNREASANLQRLEFSTRIKGGTHETSEAQRINNGLQRLIRALPLEQQNKEKAIRWLQDYSARYLSQES